MEMEMADLEAGSSTTETVVIEEVIEKDDDFAQPEAKKRKVANQPDSKPDKLELRLGGILCCAVCLDLPRAAIYQCTNGHLMCAGCFTHVLADARLRDETATCPNCRIEISKSLASRNLAVEKAVSELPSECQFCNKEFPRNILKRHEQSHCEERLTNCQYSRIGCPWRGPHHEALSHESVCLHPNRTGAEVMEALQVIDVKDEEMKKLYDHLFELLCYEKITFNDLQLKPYRTDEFVHKLFYETSRFSAFNHQWVVKARINNSQRDPTLSSERDITYQLGSAKISISEEKKLRNRFVLNIQLILKTKTTQPLNVHYLPLKGPFGDMKVSPKIHKFEFTDTENESPYYTLPLPDTAECNRLLAAKAINMRLVLFLMTK